MDKNALFAYLKHLKSNELIQLLSACYDCMKTREISGVFGDIEDQMLRQLPCIGEKILKDTRKFQKDSLEGFYYAPFDINSKNYMHIPEETDMWFEKMAELLTASTRLSVEGDHVTAIKCFGILYDLIEKLEHGDEIAFADELGMWMLPISEAPCIAAYFKSAAVVLDPEEYVKVVLPIIKYDSPSFMNKAYTKAMRSANKNQKRLLEERVIQNKISVTIASRKRR